MYSVYSREEFGDMRISMKSKSSFWKLRIYFNFEGNGISQYLGATGEN